MADAFGWGAGRSGWTPAQIPGLIFMLDAEQGITLNGAQTDAAAWAPSLGAVVSFAQATDGLRPAYNASDAAFGGRPSVGFNTTGDYLLASSSFTAAWFGFVARHSSTTFTGSPVIGAANATALNSIILVGSTGTANWLTSGGATMLGTRTRNRITTAAALGTANQPFFYEFAPTTPAAGAMFLGNYGNTPAFGFGGAITLAFAATSVPSATDLNLLAAWIETECSFDAGAP